MNNTSSQLYNILKEKIESHESKVLVIFLDGKLKGKDMRLFLTNEDPEETRAAALRKAEKKASMWTHLLFGAYCFFIAVVLTLLFIK